LRNANAFDDTVEFLDKQGGTNETYRVRRRCSRGITGDKVLDNEIYRFPRLLHTAATLEYCGMSRSKAERMISIFGPSEGHLWGCDMYFLIQGLKSPYPAIDADSEDTNEKWFEVPAEVGLKQSFYEGIMDPEFKSIRISKQQQDGYMSTYLKVMVVLEYGLDRMVQQQMRDFTSPMPPP